VPCLQQGSGASSTLDIKAVPTAPGVTLHRPIRRTRGPREQASQEMPGTISITSRSTSTADETRTACNADSPGRVPSEIRDVKYRFPLSA